MRYELKNAFFKRCAHVVSNFTNICHTLAYRHQQNMLFLQLSNSHIRNVLTVSSHTIEAVSNLVCHGVLYHKFGLQQDDEIAVANKLCMGSVEYRKDDYVLLHVDSQTGHYAF